MLWSSASTFLPTKLGRGVFSVPVKASSDVFCVAAWGCVLWLCLVAAVLLAVLVLLVVLALLVTVVLVFSAFWRVRSDSSCRHSDNCQSWIPITRWSLIISDLSSPNLQVSANLCIFVIKCSAVSSESWRTWLKVARLNTRFFALQNNRQIYSLLGCILSYVCH